MSQDMFADLLSSKKKSPNDSNVSLAQKLEQSRSGSASVNGTNDGNNWASNLDLLDQLNYSRTPSLVNLKTGNDSQMDLFTSFGSDNTPPKTTTTTTISEKNNTGTLDLLDDFFGSNLQSQSQSQSVSKTNINSSGNLLDGEFIEFIGSSPVPSAPVISNHEKKEQAQVQVPSSSKLEKRDEALAELMDMGFPIEKANAALDSTDSGDDLNGAISYLINAAHRKTRHSQQPESTPSRSDSQLRSSHDNEDFGTAINDLSAGLMNKATFLFNSGRKKLQEGIDMYKQQQFDRTNNQPLWMKNQERYKASSLKLPGQGDDDEMDPETIRRLIEQQREKGRKLRLEKERIIKQELIKKQEEANKQRLQLKQNSLFDDPATRRRPISRASSSASKTTSNTSSRQQTPVQQVSKQPLIFQESSKAHQQKQPIAELARSKPADEALFDILNSPPAFNTPPPSRLDRLRNSKVDEEPVYSSSRRRGRQTKVTSSSSTVKLPVVSISDSQKSKFTTTRAQGSEFFKKGDFPKSLELYETSLSALPSDHPLRIIAFSNLAVVYSKLGNSKKQLENSELGLSLISTISKNNSDLNTVILEDDKTVKSFWIKLVSKKAEALEHLEKFKDALDSYNQLVENGGASKPILDGKRRCLTVLEPKTNSKPKSKPIPASKHSPSPKVSSVENNENIIRVKEQNRLQESLENEKFVLHDQVELKLTQWKQGKEDNLRALLSSLQLILWPELNWKPVGLTDLVLDKKVKIAYMKAVAKTHPDKINNDVSTEKKLIANGVFISLNQAWDKFKTINNMQ